jgi:hypothetical protein
MALLEKAAEQGHAYAMNALGVIHDGQNEHENAVVWLTQGAEAGLPKAMFNLGCLLDKKQGGVEAPDYQAAIGWYRKAADSGNGGAALNLANMFYVGRGRARQMMPATSSSTL